MIYLPNSHKVVSEKEIKENAERVFKNRNEYIEFMIKQFQDHQNKSRDLKYEVSYLVYDVLDYNLMAKLEQWDQNEKDKMRTVIGKYEMNNIITNLTIRFQDDLDEMHYIQSTIDCKYERYTKPFFRKQFFFFFCGYVIPYFS